jgi:hypothetical protein
VIGLPRDGNCFSVTTHSTENLPQCPHQSKDSTAMIVQEYDKKSEENTHTHTGMFKRHSLQNMATQNGGNLR